MTEAIPQKNWATTQMKSRQVPEFRAGRVDSDQTCGPGQSDVLDRPFGESWMAR